MSYVLFLNSLLRSPRDEYELRYGDNVIKTSYSQHNLLLMADYFNTDQQARTAAGKDFHLVLNHIDKFVVVLVEQPKDPNEFFSPL